MHAFFSKNGIIMHPSNWTQLNGLSIQLSHISQWTKWQWHPKNTMMHETRYCWSSDLQSNSVEMIGTRKSRLWLGKPDGGVGPALRTTVISISQGASHLDQRTGQTLIDPHSVSYISWTLIILIFARTCQKKVILLPCPILILMTVYLMIDLLFDLLGSFLHDFLSFLPTLSTVWNEHFILVF